MDAARAMFQRLTGSIGGKIGGKKRWAGVSAKERSRQMRALVAKRKRARKPTG